jgi:hypothetical protein
MHGLLALQVCSDLRLHTLLREAWQNRAAFALMEEATRK